MKIQKTFNSWLSGHIIHTELLLYIIYFFSFWLKQISNWNGQHPLTFRLQLINHQISQRELEHGTCTSIWTTLDSILHSSARHSINQHAPFLICRFLGIYSIYTLSTLVFLYIFVDILLCVCWLAISMFKSTTVCIIVFCTNCTSELMICWTKLADKNITGKLRMLHIPFVVSELITDL